MIAPVFFVDVDTQRDFMDADGALYVPGAVEIVETLEALTHFAVARGIPVVATMDAHAPDDPEFARYPPHCVRGTRGCQKIPQTLLPRHVLLPNAPADASWEEADQVILEKQVFSMFDNVHADAVVRRLGSRRAVLYGVATDCCVRADALDLLARGVAVTLVTDAVRPLNPADGAAALAEMQARGAELRTAAEVMRDLAGD
jgi:nicotinamidase/pyrazinamidase